MIKCLVILLFSVAALYSQDDKSGNPNVELPDFVITGQDVIYIKQAKKIEPDFISTITEDFVKPEYPSDELDLRELSNPIKENLDLLETGQYFRGSLYGGAGLYVTPEAGLSYKYPFSNGILNTGFGGVYQRAYIDNSERYSLNGGASIDYTIGINEDALAGTRFLLSGDYNSSSYKLFSSSIPATKRTKNEGNYLLGIKNTTGRVFIFDLYVQDNFTSIVEDNFTENLISTGGFAKLQLSDIGIGIKSKYIKQFVKSDSLGNVDYDYVLIRPVISFELFNSVMVGAGYSFTKSGTQTFNNVYASFGLRIYKDMILLGEFNPGAELITSGSLLRENDYFSATTFTNLFFRKSNALSVSVKYEYEKYFQIDAGVKYFKSGNFPYYALSNLSGQFKFESADVESYNAYINLLFHLGPYGFLYGDLVYTRIRDKNSNNIPYKPEIKSNVTYGYELTDGFLSEVSLKLNYYSYADIANTIKLNSFVDLGLKFTYKMNDQFILNLKLSNIFNRKIYYWQGYEEKPFDLIAGFNLLFD
ncbi:hypothetical protein ACFLSS_00930 [Bacteroidota bacterium]